jgi:hypothetical protein
MTIQKPIEDDVHARPHRWSTVFLYATAVAALYWPVLRKHYVWDDWIVLHDVWTQGVFPFLARAWNPSGALLYRPLARTVFAAIALLFGCFSIPGNAARLILHLCNALLVSRIGRKLGIREDAALLAGFLYLCLATLHMDPLLWLVGLYDIAAVTFSLAAIDRFIDNRPGTFLLFAACALLTKEAAAFLLPLLLVWSVIDRRSRKQLAGIGLLAAAYVVVKLAGVSPFAVSPYDAHAMTLSPSRVFVVAQEYLGWLTFAYVPVVASVLPGSLVLAEATAVVVLWWLLRRRSPGTIPEASLAILVTWGILALLPALPLLHQSTRYAVIHAAIPVSMLLTVVLSELGQRIAPRRSGVLLAVAAGIVFAGNFYFAATTFRQGLDQQTRDDGWFHLVKRSAAVDSVYAQLFEKYSALPAGSRIVISGIPLDAIGDNAAIQLWYRDSTLTIDPGVDTTGVVSSSSVGRVHVMVNPPSAVGHE